MIKEIIVVEGKEDTRRLKEIYKEIETIETRGSAISERTIKLIETAQKSRGVIILTDPDYPGQRIRSIINNRVKGCKNAYIEQSKAISKRKDKVGIEHCAKQDIIEALQNITEIQDDISYIEMRDLYSLGLIGQEDSQALRDYLSQELNIGYNNSKQFYNKVKMFNIPLDTLQALIRQYYEKQGD